MDRLLGLAVFANCICLSLLLLGLVALPDSTHGAGRILHQLLTENLRVTCPGGRMVQKSLMSFLVEADQLGYPVWLVDQLENGISCILERSTPFVFVFRLGDFTVGAEGSEEVDFARFRLLTPDNRVITPQLSLYK